MASGRPNVNEYAPYYQGYVALVQTDNIRDQLLSAYQISTAFYENIPSEKWNFAYDEGKWNIKEVLQHINDTERVFAYRMLRIARKDKTPMPGFDQNIFAENVHLDTRDPAQLLQEYKTVRIATLSLVDSFEEEVWTFVGNASGQDVTARAIAFMIAGHEIHHRNILEEKYLD